MITKYQWWLNMLNISKSKRHLEFVAHWRFWNSCLPNILVSPTWGRLNSWIPTCNTNIFDIYAYKLVWLHVKFLFSYLGVGFPCSKPEIYALLWVWTIEHPFFSTCDQTISHWWFFFQPNTWGVSCSFGPLASKCTSPVQQPTSDKNCTKSHWHSSGISSY